MITYDEYLNKAPDTLTFERANDIFCRIQQNIDKNDEDGNELYHDFVEMALKYAGTRGGWLLLSRDEKVEQDKGRTLQHDTVINRINILARYLGNQGKDISWREELGESRKTIGDFACYVALLYGISAR